MTVTNWLISTHTFSALQSSNQTYKTIHNKKNFNNSPYQNRSNTATPTYLSYVSLLLRTRNTFPMTSQYPSASRGLTERLQDAFWIFSRKDDKTRPENRLRYLRKRKRFFFERKMGEKVFLTFLVRINAVRVRFT